MKPLDPQNRGSSTSPKPRATRPSGTYYLWDGGELLATFDENGDVIELFVNGPDGRIASYADNSDAGLYFFLRDHLNSTRAAVRSPTIGTPTTAQFFNYFPFGAAQESWGSNKTAYQYTGVEHDEEWRFDGYNCNAREYDPYHGRFNSVDKADQFASGWNYCGNNPVSFSDPEGNYSGIPINRDPFKVKIPGIARWPLKRLKVNDDFLNRISGRRLPALAGTRNMLSPLGGGRRLEFPMAFSTWFGYEETPGYESGVGTDANPIQLGTLITVVANVPWLQRAYSAVRNWTLVWYTAATDRFDAWNLGWYIFGEFASGKGESLRQFGPDDPFTRLLRYSPAVQRRLAEYRADPDGYVAWTGFGPGGFAEATLTANPAWHFVGSFNLEISQVGDDEILVGLTNITSYSSFTRYLDSKPLSWIMTQHNYPMIILPPTGVQWDRIPGKLTPYGNITQVIRWKERF